MLRVDREGSKYGRDQTHWYGVNEQVSGEIYNYTHHKSKFMFVKDDLSFFAWDNLSRR